MKRMLFAAGLLAACAPEPAPEPTPELPFVRGYRHPADQCQLVGESTETSEYLDDAADLVACPTDYEGMGVFITETGGRKVVIYENYTLITVPTR